MGQEERSKAGKNCEKIEFFLNQLNIYTYNILSI